MLAILVVLALVSATPLLAEQVAEQKVVGGTTALAERLPPEVVTRLGDAPRLFEEEAAGLIFAYGAGGAITAEGIDTAIAHDRAKARARAVEDLMAADLNADGVLSGPEVIAAGRAMSPRASGLLWSRHGRADTDGDGSVDGVELAAYARARALAAMGPVEAARAHDLMLLDLDADGRVTLDEVALAMQALRGEV